jgi:hypothetical protein
MHYYNPHTLEHIPNAKPAPWMEGTEAAPPSYNPETAGAFFRSGGWVIEEASSSDMVPTSVSMRQARLALLAIGKLADVDAAIAGMDEPAKSAAQIEWEYAATVERASPLIAQLGPALGLDDGQLDALFVQAATL